MVDQAQKHSHHGLVVAQSPRGVNLNFCPPIPIPPLPMVGNTA
jgi:hypothetical protein